MKQLKLETETGCAFCTKRASRSLYNMFYNHTITATVSSMTTRGLSEKLVFEKRKLATQEKKIALTEIEPAI